MSEAETARARRAEWDALAPRLTGQRADQALVLAELTAIRGLYPDPGALRAAHQAFLARAQAGFYDPVRGTDAWRGLVGRWTEDARRPWDEPWFADQQLAVTLATWDLDPPRDDAAKETRTKKLQSLIAGAYGK